MVRSLREPQDQAEEDVSKAATGESEAARPFYKPAATLLAALRFYAQERGLNARWVQQIVAAGNFDAMGAVARVLQRQGDTDSITAARSIEDVIKIQNVLERRSVLAAANITLWRLPNADRQVNPG